MHFAEALPLIKRANNILCLTQAEATPDGLASILALQVLMNRLKKECTIVAPKSETTKLNFLTGYELIHQNIPGSNEVVITINDSIKDSQVQKNGELTEITIKPAGKTIDLSTITVAPKVANFDLIIAVDMPNLESLGDLFQEQVRLFTNTPIISISANPTHDYFGRVALSSAQASSSSEIIFDLINGTELNKHLDKTISTILLTGIIASTGSFLEQNTTPNALKAASVLQKNGALQSDIIENLFKKKPLATLKIWGRVLGNLQVDENHRIAWSNIQKSDFSLTESSPKDIDDISDNLLRFTYGTDLSAILYESPNQTHVQLRTNNPSINLNELQKNFGGKIVKNGLDITVKDKTIADIEGNLLHALTDFQKKRLNLEKDLKIETKVITKAETPKTTHLDLHIKSKKTHATPHAPKDIPFTAPLQPHEKTGKVGDDETGNKSKSSKAQKSKSGYSPKKSGIPEWLSE